MLTSSDAKFRCLWHMFVWSILLTLVSQFYVLSDHIAFYIFGSICILVLPIVTSLYSNTAGRRGAGLLRVAYVLCDPVIACMALVPVLLIKRLTPLINEMECLSVDIHSWNMTLICLRDPLNKLYHHISHNQLPFKYKTAFWLERRHFLTGIEVSLCIPCIIACLMGRRTRKMNLKTALLVFCYWLVVSIECAGMIEASVVCGSSRLHYAVTTEVTVCVACILANSYGLVTLCSYISPMQCKGDKEQVAAHFDLVYKCVVGVFGVAFVELPQLIARLQMLVATSDWPSSSDINNFIDESHGGKFSSYKKHFLIQKENEKNLNNSNTTLTLKESLNSSSIFKLLFSKFISNSSLYSNTQNLTNFSTSTQSIIPTSTLSFAKSDKLYRLGFPPSFYLWVLKDALMIFIIIAFLVLQRLGKGRPAFMKLLSKDEGCVGTAFDNLNTVFLPEKRDEYIITRCAKCKKIDLTNGGRRNHRNHHRSNRFSSWRPSNQSSIDHPNKLNTNSHNSTSNSYQSIQPQTSVLPNIDKQLKETYFSNNKIKNKEFLWNKSDDFKAVKLKEYNHETSDDIEKDLSASLFDDDVVEDNLLDYHPNDLPKDDYVAGDVPNCVDEALNKVDTNPSCSKSHGMGVSHDSWIFKDSGSERHYSLDESRTKKKKKSVKFSLS